MGISLNIAIQMARIAPMVRACTRGVMLGRQRMNFAPPRWTPRLLHALEGLGVEATEEALFQPDGYCERFLQTIGWPALESLDIAPGPGIDYACNISATLPRRMRGRFDLIFDGSTSTDHFDYARALRNINAMLRPGGTFVSTVPADGWFGNGFYQIGPDLPWRFWVHAMGYDMLGCWTFARNRRGEPRDIPDPTGHPRGGEHIYEDAQFLFYVVRKPKHRITPDLPARLGRDAQV